MKLLHSFGYAFKGILLSFQQRNMKIHGLATAVVLILGVVFSLSRLEFIALFGCIGLVFTAELFNTAVEELCNGIVRHSSAHFPSMGVPKDLAAGAVLVTAITAVIIGLLIFVPHILFYLR